MHYIEYREVNLNTAIVRPESQVQDLSVHILKIYR